MLTIDTPMDESVFLIQELNPFQEWHTHATENKLGHALFLAEKICQQLGVPVRVLSRSDHVVALLKPKRNDDLVRKNYNN